MKQLIYRSEPFGFDRATLAGILMTARRNNRRDDITGALLCRSDLYLQLIEGPEAAIGMDSQNLQVFATVGVTAFAGKTDLAINVGLDGAFVARLHIQHAIADKHGDRDGDEHAIASGIRRKLGRGQHRRLDDRERRELGFAVVYEHRYADVARDRP